MVKAQCARYRQHGKPWHRSRLQNLDDYDIVRIYGAEYRGVINYYLPAQNVSALSTLEWHAITSMLKTLAAKHRSTVSKMAARHAAKVTTADGPRRCFEARRRREGKEDLVARFGGIPLRQDRRAIVRDPVPVPVAAPRKELLSRLRKRRCELCETGTTVAVHQVAGLKELGQPGPGQPAWALLMARMRRKTLIVCASCHDWIHANPPRTRHESLESSVHLTVHAEFGGRLPGKGWHLLIPDLAGQPTLPGYDLITAILDAGGHVVARVSATVALPLAPGGGWLPDGSRLTWLNAPSGKKQDRLPVRAAEHNAVLPGGDGKQVSQTCAVITTLTDHEAAPADAVRDAYLTRWSASETTFGEDKATITGAGNRTSGPVLRSGSPRLVISEAWAWLTGTQLVRASAVAALRTEAAAARALRREDHAPVTADEESFTATWRHAIRSMTSTQVTASSSLEAIAAEATPPPAPPCTPSTSPVGSGTQNAPRKHARNSRTPPRPRQPSPGNPRSPCSHPASASPSRTTSPSGRRRNRPGPPGTADRGTARQARRDTRAAALPGHRKCHHGNGLKNRHRTPGQEHLRTTQTPKVPGVAICPVCRLMPTSA